MGFQMVKICLTSGDPKGQRSRSNPKNFEVEYLEKRYEIERKCQWKLDRKSYMGFQKVNICLISGDP